MTGRAAAAEIIATDVYGAPGGAEPSYYASGPPEIYAAADAEYDPLTRERFNRWLGSLAMPTTTEMADAGEVSETSAGDTNLLEMLRQARAGSPEALKSVEANVSKAVVEACFKNDHVTTAFMERDENGQPIQFGQSWESVQRNALVMRPGRHEKLQRITQAEALNAHRINDALEAGALKDHYFVVISMVPEGVPQEQLGHKGDGYFLDGLTFVVQATDELADGRVKTESGFMAGVEAGPGDTFEDRMAQRHDLRAASLIYERAGLESPGTAAGFLANGMYVPKALMPNGIVDFMKLMAEAGDEVLGRDVERKIEDFMALQLASKRREASLANVRQKVVDALLADTPRLAEPMDAVRRMWELVKTHTAEDSLTNLHIDPRVFGSDAAEQINRARHYLQRGAEQMAREAMEIAHELAIVTGCGGGSGSSKGGGGSGGHEKDSAGSDKHGSLKFECPNGHVNVRKPDEWIYECQVCKVDVSCGKKR